MKKCELEHKHEYVVRTRGFDCLFQEEVSFETWEELNTFIDNLGCECCSYAPDISDIKPGRLYEYGYRGSFRVIGCLAWGKLQD